MKAALRLRRPLDFARVQRSGVIYRHRDLNLSVCGSELSHNRYGIVTSKRLGNAVARNKCKRRVRAILGHFHSEMHQGFDVVVVARPAIIRQPFRELFRILCGLLAQARLMEECSDAKVGAAEFNSGL